MGTNLGYEKCSWGDDFPLTQIGIADRPVALYGPRSFLGEIYAKSILDRCRHAVAVVDDRSPDATIHGVPRWTTQEFHERAVGIPELIAIDLTAWPMGYAMFRRLVQVTSVQSADLVSAIAEFGLPAVYQTPIEMRDRTIARQSEWASLRRTFVDDRSRETLDAILLLRLTCDRRWVRAVMTGPEDEYFSFYASDATFRLCHDEIFCDAGAYVGETVRKVVASTEGQFREIHAFEPDRTSFAKLEDLSTLRFSNIQLHNTAVGDYTGHVRFLETGNTGSHVDEVAGNSADTPITRLDDAVESVTFIKMDLEGFETRALAGARRLIAKDRPRIAVTGYHYADDLLDIVAILNDLAPDYELRLRHHSSYYYDTIIYASPRSALGGIR